MARNAYGAGTNRQVAPGKWELRISVGTDPVTSKHQRKTKTVAAATEKAATKELAAFVAEVHATRSGDTLGQLLVEYLDNCHDMSPTGRAENDGMIARYLTPHLASRKVTDITAHDLDRLYGHLRAKGGVCRLSGIDAGGAERRCTKSPCEHGGGERLSAATVDRFHTLVHAALEQAVRWDYLTSNPATRCRPIVVDPEEVRLPPAEHLVRLLAHLDGLELDGHDQAGSPLPDFVALLLGTGARPGELCALTWGDLELDLADSAGNRYGVATIAASVARARCGGAVVKSTKTRKRRRVTIAGPVVDVLERRVARWRSAALASGQPLESLAVFPSKGRATRPWRPDSMSREFREARDGLKLSEDLTLRNLRHHGVSTLAAAGVDVVTVAKRMGHSPQIMFSVYAHLFEALDLGAAEIQGQQLASR